jgi:integrase
MLIKVEGGKGRKDRYTMLSAKLLQELRRYYKKYRPQTYLFP